MGACDFYDENDYDWNSYANEPNDDRKERFTSIYPYEYDNETGYSHSHYSNSDYWTDCVGNKYEQKTDCWGSIYYEKVKDEGQLPND